MSTPFEKRKEELLNNISPLIDLMTKYQTENGYGDYQETFVENSAILAHVLDTLAKEVAQVAVVEEDEYFYDFDKPDTDKEELAQEWYETMAEAEAGGNNRARSQSIQQLKDYGIDVEGV